MHGNRASIKQGGLHLKMLSVVWKGGWLGLCPGLSFIVVVDFHRTIGFIPLREPSDAGMFLVGGRLPSAKNTRPV